MAYRAWFSTKICEGLTTTDVRILNCATRHLVDEYGMEASSRNLMDVRMAYRPGMAAIDVINEVAVTLGFEDMEFMA